MYIYNCKHGYNLQSMESKDGVIKSHQWLSARLQYLQCVSTGDTAVLHQAFDTYINLNFSTTIFFCINNTCLWLLLLYSVVPAKLPILMIMWCYVRVWYLLCISNGDTIVLYKAIKLISCDMLMNNQMKWKKKQITANSQRFHTWQEVCFIKFPDGQPMQNCIW